MTNADEAPVVSLAPHDAHLLVRSLAGRIFGPQPPEGARHWVAARVGPIALAGVEHPPMLPFLRVVFRDRRSAQRSDPLLALHDLLIAHGMEERAWKRIPRWGFDSFSRLDGRLGATTVALFSNLLLHMDVQAPPPPNFVREANEIAYYRQCEGELLDYERHPAWFMRAILEGVSLALRPSQVEALRDRVHCCVDWLLDARPEPDANQQRAGWFWMVPRAMAYREGRRLAATDPWMVPAGEMTLGPWWVVPIRTAADLAEEAIAMKNCLREYEDDCRFGSAAVFSIRDALTSERAASFVIGRSAPEDPWELEQVKAKQNGEVGVALQAVAARVVERLTAGTPA